MSVERASRFVVAWASGPREEALARQVVAATRRRTKDQAGISHVSDGWTPYAETVKQVYRDRIPSGVRPGWDILRPTPDVRLTQAVKHRKGRRLVEDELRATIGEQVAQPYAVHLERLNGAWRDRLGCLTRKTHAFAKDVATWDALVSLALFEHNWIRAHRALRRALPPSVAGRRYEPRTPAMALGLAGRPWCWEEFFRFPVGGRGETSTTSPEGRSSA
jgi:IS1 family transposase